MKYLGDLTEDATVDFAFTTRDFAGDPATLAGTPALSVYKANGTTETTDGITLSVDHDSRTGLNQVRIDTSADAFYATGNDYDVVITTGTINGRSLVGEVVASFSIENRNIKADLREIAGNDTNATNLGTAASNYSTTRGLAGTALPAAAADAAGGLVISDAGGLDIDSKLANAVPSANDNRDAVLNRVLNGNHDTAGTTGKILQDAATASTQVSHSASLSSIISTLGTNGDGLTAIPWNAAWDAEVQSECADALAAYNVVATTDLPSNFGSLGINASGHVSRVTLTDTTTTNTDMRGTDSAYTGTPPTAGAIADAVWDEVQSGHTTAGTFGKYLDSEVSGAGGGSGLTQQQVADALKLAPSAGSPAAGSVNADLDTLLTRTAGSTLSIVTPVAEDGELTLYAGAEYSNTDGTALAFNFTDDNDPDLTGDSAILRILTVANWEAGTYDDPALELTDGVVTHDGGTTATATFEATEAETALLVVPGPPADCNYRYQVLTNTGTRLRVRASGACTVKPVIDASS